MNVKKPKLVCKTKWGGPFDETTKHCIRESEGW
jgi:hypothetical protein